MFLLVPRFGSVTARHSSSGGHLYSAGRPSRWALDHISSRYWWAFTFSDYLLQSLLLLRAAT